ncbi:hypothetical protein G7Y89_g6693 [Cudoniella acicularis]|uniref:NAD(P)-binding domain-containing protein n=1 Tax=Cudoniella acicularis TaxID=354080 RepID=A0A8H4RK08_9HELO|nr:hypothetical protein G7Y89_g6693 [Cudoniella acicularis]
MTTKVAREGQILKADSNINGRKGKRTVPMEVLNLAMPRTGMAAAYLHTDSSAKCYHVDALLKDSTRKSIIALSRNPTVNLHENVIYRACDITNESAIVAVIEEFKPRVIFYTASPRPKDKIKKNSSRPSSVAPRLFSNAHQRHHLSKHSFASQVEARIKAMNTAIWTRTEHYTTSDRRLCHITSRKRKPTKAGSVLAIYDTETAQEFILRVWKWGFQVLEEGDKRKAGRK